MFSKISLSAIRRYLVTLAVVLVALFIGWRLWIHYENDPWTRDGRIKADVVQVAPDVTGQVVKLHVIDNQVVNVGDVLFEIDPERFELALRQAKAAEEAAKVTLAQAIRESNRNRELKDLVATEVTEQGQSRVEEARAALLQAIVNRDKAQLDLDRTKVVAAVDGIVTNLVLRTGSYVTASHPVMALVDRNSYYAEGYFEETKLPNIAVGDRATIRLMSDDEVLEGHVHSISRGIEDRERTTGGKLMQNINPAFNWVRLVQRIPVRIEFDSIPENVRLVSGQTVTIEVFPSEKVTVAKNDQPVK
ncbi:HlyD family secretion protein [Oxalobacter aliiformigenes]|uniref:HlyD family secretion protein n=1 Tax=Oxalobacter aliiformigenes TaxID=2946593 RepID=A0ABY7JJL6_9BURK|nr:HlyD family secretion protein [Oxalobacter aliiformigenes]WAV88667.1 HlyD family secretion protein [Oxalobacter aliiformigenes]WAV92735.1 HlyD family secretion protein [Oxalobacter aliiformigenes]WAV95759.1 HlyD family secretion protein [Oxalobacter aliiformigenes]WAV96449.1 HlyD family secretion protein [Oxalobacter aliiformigenes]